MKNKLLFSLIIPQIVFCQLNTFVSEWQKDTDLKSATLSYCVYDFNNNLTLAEHNAHTFVIPASTLKIVTTAAALSVLGTNYKYKTTISYTGVLNKQTGVLDGDIIIKGSGDPTLQSESFYKKDTLTNKWAQEIKAAGIKTIKGSIIGDASCWDHTVPGNWVWADINNYFGAVPCGLSFMENKFQVVFKSKALGTNAEFVKINPELLGSKIKINNTVIAEGTKDEAYVYGDPFGYTKNISGKIPPNKTAFEIEAAQPDPALLCAEFLLDALKKTGINCIENKAVSCYEKTDRNLNLIYTHYSPSLERIVQITNISSNNLFAESLLKTLGGGNSSVGIGVVRKFLSNNNLDSSEINMVDGSGLSRANIITTSLQATLLGKIYLNKSISKSFYNSLPIAGKQGSMSNIGKGTYIQDKMRAKTGYINRARGYCGYVTTKTGKELAFSILFNNYNCNPSSAKLKIEKFMIALGEL